MTTKVYFKVTWDFIDGRNSVSSDLIVDMNQDVFDSIPDTDFEEKHHISAQFCSAFYQAFPQFNKTDYEMTALGMNDSVIILIPFTNHCFRVDDLIEIHKKICIKAEGAIQLKIVQRQPTHQPLVTNIAIVANNSLCQECQRSIKGISFVCSQCDDYNLCCLCVTSGKHPQHGVVRATDSKVDRDTVAKLRSTSVKIKKEESNSKALVKKLMAKNKEQEAKIKLLDTENKRLVTAGSEAMACLEREFGSCDDISIPENKKRKSGGFHGTQK